MSACPNCGIDARRCVNTDECEIRCLRAEVARLTEERDEALERESKWSAELANVLTYRKERDEARVSQREHIEMMSRERREAIERAEKAERERSNLLARIHRDGGQYEEQHGAAKAVADADTTVARLHALNESQAQTIDLLRANGCSESCTSGQDEAKRLRAALKALLWEMGDDSDGMVLRPSPRAMGKARAALSGTTPEATTERPLVRHDDPRVTCLACRTMDRSGTEHTCTAPEARPFTAVEQHTLEPHCREPNPFAPSVREEVKP